MICQKIEVNRLSTLCDYCGFACRDCVPPDLREADPALADTLQGKAFMASCAGGKVADLKDMGACISDAHLASYARRLELCREAVEDRMGPALLTLGLAGLHPLVEGEVIREMIGEAYETLVLLRGEIMNLTWR